NESYGADLPHASLLQFFSNNAPVDASLVMLPRWLEINYLEAPWSRFSVPFWGDDLDEAPEENTSNRRRATRRGGRVN
ncbi:MAG: hypothetical protein R3338_15515, partial [Thermoanaerobaculia bacterium]|nr:hypothetical protein [Thermoanaerobaculia bacterium]